MYAGGVKDEGKKKKREKMIGVFLEKKGERRVFFLDFGLGEE